MIEGPSRKGTSILRELDLRDRVQLVVCAYETGCRAGGD
jgi:hypothetical protein